MAKYMTPDDLTELLDPKTGSFICTVNMLRIEEIDQRPQLVMYVDEDPRGIIVHRKLYEDLTRDYGRSPFAEAFFQHQGLQ
jgi:hypothetical protein